MKIWNPLILLSAVLLSAISVALPVVQWATIPTDVFAKALAGLAAFALAVCKLGFFPLAWKHIANRRWVPGTALGLFAVLLLAISVDATRDLLRNQTIERQQINQAGDEQNRILKRRLDDLNREIDTFSGLLADDQANDYRERAYQQIDRLQNLKQERASIAAQLAELTREHQAATETRFGISLGDDNPNAGSTLKELSEGELITSLTIHIGCVLAVLSCGVWAQQPEQNPQKKPKERPVRTPEKPEEIREPQKPKESGVNELDADQVELAKQIVAGAWGDRPGVKAIVESKQCPGGFPKVKAVFDYLLEKEQLKREGRFYYLTQTVIA